MDILHTSRYFSSMPTVTIKEKSQLPAQATFSKICELIDKADELRKLDPNYECHFDSNNLTGTASSRLFKAKLSVSDLGESSLVELSLTLPLHLALAKGLVERKLKKQVKEFLT